MQRQSREGADASLPRVVLDDLRHTRLDRDYVRELRELYQFYLDDERLARLAGMGRPRRAVLLLGWTLKSLLMKLAPARRLMLVAALVGFWAAQLARTLTGSGLSAGFLSFDPRPWAFALLLIVLMLELRDKLLAQDEIEIARQVQLRLLPHDDPIVPGWIVWGRSRPANDVGGDLVDYVEMDGARHGVVLGDVAGKGLGAALLMAKLQATLRAVLPAVTSLDELGTRVNAILHRDGLDNRYATLFFAELAHDTGQVRYLNAGHNPACVIRRDRLERLAASSYPLGLLASPSYEQGSVELLPGEMLLAYSDGLTESRNEAGEEFGAERLERLLPGLRGLEPAAAGDRILAAVAGFAGDRRPDDDLSLAIIARR